MVTIVPLSGEKGTVDKRFWGLLAAVVDGFCLSVWGIVSKKFAEFNPGAFEYSSVLLVAGIGHLVITLLPIEESRTRNFEGLNRKFYGLLTVFVLISVAQFYLGVKVFEFKEADVAVSSFLRNSSLVFAALLAHCARYSGGMFIENRLNAKTVFGSLLFMLGVWVFFGAPIGKQNGTMYLSFWVVGSLLIGFNRSLTELLMQKFAKSISRTQMNVAIGGGLGLLGFAGCLINIRGMGPFGESLPFLLAVGLIIPVMQAFRFSALKVMNEILGKKGYTIWTYLLSSMLLGAYVFGEGLPWSKWLGLAIGASAVAMLDSNTGSAIMGLLRRKKVLGA